MVRSTQLLCLVPLVAAIGTPAIVSDGHEATPPAVGTESLSHVLPGEPLSTGGSVRFGPLTGAGQGPVTGSIVSVSGVPMGPGPVVASSVSALVSGSDISVPSGGGGAGAGSTTMAGGMSGSATDMASGSATDMASGGGSSAPTGGAGNTGISAQASSAASVANTANSGMATGTMGGASSSSMAAGAAKKEVFAGGALAGLLGLVMAL